MKVNRILKAKIVQHYGTQEDFASVIKVDAPLVSRVVRGRRQLPPEAKEKWAQALGTRVEEIFAE